MQSTATITPPLAGQPYRFTVDKYLKMAEKGILDPSVHTELVDGQVIVMSPKNLPHTKTKVAIRRRVQRALGDDDAWDVLDQDSIRVPDQNMPEPDIAVVPPLGDALPLASEALLIVEVSDTTLADDLGRKRLLYAGAGVPNYWVADVNLRQLHRFAEPHEGDYRLHEVLGVRDTVRVPGVEGAAASIPVAAFFP